MANWRSSLRDKFEKLMFTGLKPDQPLEHKKKPKIEELLKDESIIFAGLKPEEKPLSGPMSRRKKIAIAFGILVLAGFVGALAFILLKPADQPETAAPPSHKIEFVLPPNLKIDKNKDLDVFEINFKHDREPYFITGILKNKTDRHFTRCEVSFDVTTAEGAQLGGVATMVKNLGPHASAKFQIPVPQKNAAFAMVRELRAE